MNFELNLLHHVGVVAKRLRAATELAPETHEGDDDTLSGPSYSCMLAKKQTCSFMLFNNGIVSNT